KTTVLLPLPVLLLFGLIWLAGLALARWRPVWTRWPGLVREWVALGALAALNLGFFWRVLLTRDTWLPRGGGDFNSFYYPLYHFAAEQITRGHIPLWNPHLWGGMPFAADQQTGLFLPFNLLAFVVARPFGYGTLEWLAIGQVWLASVFAYAFCRELGVRRIPAVIGGVTFAYSGFLVTHLGHYPMVAVAVWLPATLLALRRALLRCSLGWTLALAGAVLMAILGGHQQILLYLLTATALYWLFLTWTESPAPWWPGGLREVVRWLRSSFAAHWIRCAGQFVIALGIAAGLAAPALLPSLQLARRSIRAAISYTESTAFSLRPLHLITLIVPNAFGTTPTTYISAVGFSGEVFGYAGVIALGLAGLAFVRALPCRRREAAFFGGLAVLALAVTLGPTTPLQGWFYAFVPGYSRVRASGRWFLLFDFAIATLAALGADNLLRLLVEEVAATRPLLRRIAIGLGGALTVGILVLPFFYATLLAPRDPSAPLAQFLDSAAFTFFLVGLALMLALALAAGRLARTPAALALVTLVIFDLFAVTGPVPPTNDDPLTGFQHDDALALLRQDTSGPFRIDQSRLGAGWQPSWAAIAGLDSVAGTYDPLGVYTYNRYWDVASKAPGSALYNLLNVRYTFTPPDKPLDTSSGQFREVGRGRDYILYQNNASAPLAFIVGRAAPAAQPEEAWAAISAAGFDPRAVVYLSPALDGTSSPLPDFDQGAPQGTVAVAQTGTDAVTASVESDREAILVFSEVAYPGWRATIDGRAAPLLTADYTFRAVEVPSGRHEVRLTFAPPLWRGSWLIAGVTALVVVALLVVLAVTRRREHDISLKSHSTRR
ncbi:MAG: YfhO family protein, partial [Thermomicrobiales bacterium]